MPVLKSPLLLLCLNIFNVMYRISNYIMMVLFYRSIVVVVVVVCIIQILSLYQEASEDVHTAGSAGSAGQAQYSYRYWLQKSPEVLHGFSGSA